MRDVKQKEDEGNEGLLLNGARALMAKDTDKANGLCAFFTSLFTDKTFFQVWSLSP